MQNKYAQHPEQFMDKLVRYRAELLTPEFIEEHGAVAVDCVFKVLQVKDIEGRAFVHAEVPGSMLSRDILIDQIELV